MSDRPAPIAPETLLHRYRLAVVVLAPLVIGLAATVVQLNSKLTETEVFVGVLSRIQKAQAARAALLPAPVAGRPGRQILGVVDLAKLAPGQPADGHAESPELGPDMQRVIVPAGHAIGTTAGATIIYVAVGAGTASTTGGKVPFGPNQLLLVPLDSSVELRAQSPTVVYTFNPPAAEPAIGNDDDAGAGQ